MQILIAPDKFKGTLNAREVAQNIAKGLLDVTAGRGDRSGADGRRRGGDRRSDL